MRPFLVFAALFAFAACSPEEELKNLVPAGVCAGGEAPGTVSEFINLGEFNEGIAFGPDNRMYVAGSDTGTLWAITADGAKQKFATVESALGVAFLGTDLIVAGLGSDTVYKVDPSGKAVTYAAEVSQPNFVTVTPWKTTLVSNDFGKTIHEVVAGKAVLWSDAVNSANGMVFSQDGTKLYVATTFDKTQDLWEIPVANQKAGTPRKVAQFESGSTPDGVAMDSDGNVYVALNVVKKIVRVDPATGTIEPVAEKLQFPASMAFGQGEFDHCSMYVTQLFGKGVHKVRIGKKGAPLFY